MSKTVDKKSIAIFGAGGFGMEVEMLIEQINQRSPEWEMIGFFDDNVPGEQTVNGHRVLGDLDILNQWDSPLYVAFAIGNPSIKRNVVGSIKNRFIKYPVLMHPSVISGNERFVSIGEGSIICAGCILTTNIVIGKHVVFNLACTVGHESEIGSYSAFMPTCNISGEVVIGHSTYWGTGAKIINRKKVGDHAVIGAGAVVTSDIPPHVTAVGIPAKVIKHRDILRFA